MEWQKQMFQGNTLTSVAKSFHQRLSVLAGKGIKYSSEYQVAASPGGWELPSPTRFFDVLLLYCCACSAPPRPPPPSLAWARLL